MVEAHIVYTGIIGFYEVGESVNIVAPMGYFSNPPHLTWLLCDQQQRKEASTLPKVPHGADEGLELYLIDGDMTVIGPSGSGKPDLFNDGLFTKDQVLSLDHCRPDGGATTLSKECLRDVDRERKTALRGELVGGSLTAQFVDRRRKWGFEHQQYNDFDFMAEEICHRVNLGMGRVKFSFERAGQPFGELLLGPSNLIDPEPVIVVIGHTPLEDVFPKAAGGSIDTHMRLYYALAKEQDVDRSHLVSVEPNGGGPVSVHRHQFPSLNKVRAFGANCPPGWWDTVEED